MLCWELGKQQWTKVLVLKELTVSKVLDESGAQEMLLEELRSPKGCMGRRAFWPFLWLFTLDS